MVKKTILLKSAKEKIEIEQMNWASNTIVIAYQSKQEGPEAKKQLDAATHNCEASLAKIAWLESYIKSLK